MKWLTFGDKNFSFFHATTIQRRDRNKLYRLKDKDGVWVEGQSDDMKAIEEYFSAVYVQAIPVRSNCLNVVPNLVSEESNLLLMATVTAAEIEKAVFSLGALPDGLNGVFFQKNWETIKGDVLAAITEFFAYDSLGDSINDTLVS